MATCSKSFTLLETPQRIWAVLVDFPRWDRLLVMRKARSRGWGDRFAVRAGAGAGMELAMINGESELFQEWAVDEWSEPTRLRLSSRLCHGEANTHMNASFEFNLSPVSTTETRVEIRADADFSHPFWSVALFWLPIKGEVSRVVDRMERGIVQAVSA